ncbi:hypothetical protein PRZ48_012006 [Zasmidium cellare]|uniref:Uncharacterized protein n=1 Tax=Zasmidium cellare TaxID=395010 RepID=A0ABR0E7Z3_ZASCE|nr:hypothetical protein PRZ48_012006 [Zasmidium cellare]
MPGNNMNESPFFKLSAELRNRIYEEVLTNKTIHIATHQCPKDAKGAFPSTKLYRKIEHDHPRPGHRKFSYSVCVQKESERDLYDRSRSCSSQGGCRWLTIRPYYDRHEKCLQCMEEFEDAWCSYQDRGQPNDTPAEKRRLNQEANRLEVQELNKEFPLLALGLLRVCRQIHHEAALVPYESNTFAFREGFALDLFFSEKLLPQQREAVKSIQLGDWSGDWIEGVNVDACIRIRRSTILSLKNLSSVEICLEERLKLHAMGLNPFARLGLENVRVYVQGIGEEPEDYSDESGTDFDFDFEGEMEEGGCGVECRRTRAAAEEAEAWLKKDPTGTSDAKRSRPEEKGKRRKTIISTLGS